MGILLPPQEPLRTKKTAITKVLSHSDTKWYIVLLFLIGTMVFLYFDGYIPKYKAKHSSDLQSYDSNEPDITLQHFEIVVLHSYKNDIAKDKDTGGKKELKKHIELPITEPPRSWIELFEAKSPKNLSIFSSVVDDGLIKTKSPKNRSVWPSVVDEGPIETMSPKNRSVWPSAVVEPKVLYFVNGEDKDAAVREKRDKVVEMMLSAWSGYKKNAWGKNEMRPPTILSMFSNLFGNVDMGASIFESMDTLYLMGLTKEFEQGRNWIANLFTIDNKNINLSVGDTTTRYIAGLLTCFAFTGDTMFRDKAKYLADKLLPAFMTPTGIPKGLVNSLTGQSHNYWWADSNGSILSEFGTLHLEFSYLSDVTGNPKYHDLVMNIRKVLKNTTKSKGLYQNYLNPITGEWPIKRHVSFGAMGNSFYEYLLKAWIQSGQTDTEARQMYDEAIMAIVRNMVTTSPGGLTYISELKTFDEFEHKMYHLACFAGGLFGLGGATLKNQHTDQYMELATNITKTCHESYARTATKLGPAAFRFTKGAEAQAVSSEEMFNVLRPETIESYFIMWRLTKDQKYRDWGWEALLAIEKHCQTPNGFSGIKNVYMVNPIKDNIMRSDFMGATLKYFYLLFSDDSLLPLEDWVWNTEGHPLPIKGKNSFYRPITNGQ